MSREAELVRSLVEMADTLVDDYDVVDLLTGLTGRCVNLLGASAAGVMLTHPYGRLGLVASSSEAMRLLELFELQAQEGPCLDAIPHRRAVAHEILDAGSGRWPVVHGCGAQGRLPVGCRRIPLRWRDTTLGALNLLSTSQDPMAEADRIVARAFADLAAVSIVHHRASIEARRLNEQLVRRADQSRGHRAGQGRALGAGRHRPGGGLLPDALLSPAISNLRLTDVAESAVAGTLEPRRLAAAGRPVARWRSIATARRYIGRRSMGCQSSVGGSAPSRISNQRFTSTPAPPL